MLTDRPENKPEWLPVAKVADQLFQRTGASRGAIETGVIELDGGKGEVEGEVSDG